MNSKTEDDDEPVHCKGPFEIIISDFLVPGENMVLIIGEVLFSFMAKLWEPIDIEHHKLKRRKRYRRMLLCSASTTALQ